MTQSELVSTLAHRLGASQEEIKTIFHASAQVMRRVLDDDQGFTVPGLGTFHAVMKPRRKGYNPRLRRQVLLPPKRVVGFHASAPLKEAVKFRRVSP